MVLKNIVDFLTISNWSLNWCSVPNDKCLKLQLKIENTRKFGYQIKSEKKRKKNTDVDKTLRRA